MPGESQSRGAEAISTKAVTTTAPRASGITASPGTMVVVKKVTMICCLEPTAFFFFRPQVQRCRTLYTPFSRKPSEVINRFKPQGWRYYVLISICLFCPVFDTDIPELLPRNSQHTFKHQQDEDYWFWWPCDRSSSSVFFINVYKYSSFSNQDQESQLLARLLLANPREKKKKN